jgi:hypothetical protein
MFPKQTVCTPLLLHICLPKGLFWKHGGLKPLREVLAVLRGADRNAVLVFINQLRSVAVQHGLNDTSPPASLLLHVTVCSAL